MMGNLLTLHLHLTDERRQAAMAAHRAAVGLDVAETLAIERIRVCGLITLSTQASRIGVAFDLHQAIGDGLSLDACRAEILHTASTQEDQS